MNKHADRVMTKQNIKLFFISLLLASPSYQVKAQDVNLLMSESTVLSPVLVSKHLSDQELSSHRGQGFVLPEIPTSVILWDEVDNGSKPNTHHSDTDGNHFTLTVDMP